MDAFIVWVIASFSVWLVHLKNALTERRKGWMEGLLDAQM
jgi:hypothetical protein